MSSAGAVQIITPKDHKFELQLENLKQFFESANIRDRDVVLLSIAGPYRKGKSFILNFFLRYLHAQYEKHDISDWIGENESSVELDGFKAKGGRKPETNGIWMYSKIFTHDFENGEKVAIVLLDTQGIFDNRTNTKECTSIFALSMLLASIQCYNVMQNVQEDDLQSLELFTEFSRLAAEHSSEKLFQKLCFIIRDWQNSSEIPFGDSEQYVDELLAESHEQTVEMHNLRRRIKSSFDEIGAFLMPYPGNAVATGVNIGGDLKQIDSEFIAQVKKLVPALLAPEKLVVKRINGQKVRGRDLVTYMQTYVNIFNGNTLPDPQTAIMGTALATIMTLFNECLNLYVESMHKSFEERSSNDDEPFFNETDLEAMHQNAKAKFLSKFQEKRQLGGDEIMQPFRNKLAMDMDIKYRSFKQENEGRRTNFIAIQKSNLHVLHLDCLKLYCDSMQKSLRETEAYYSLTELQNKHEDAMRRSLSMFVEHKNRGGNELIQSFKNKLENDIAENFQRFQQENENKRKFTEDLQKKSAEAAARAIEDAKAEEMRKAVDEAKADVKNMHLYNDCLDRYMNSMRRTLNDSDTFYSKSHLEEIHENAKEKSLSKFKQEHDNAGRDAMLSARLETAIDMNLIQFNYENDKRKRENEEKEEWRRSNKQLQDQLKETSASQSGMGDFFLGILPKFFEGFTSIFKIF